MMASTKFPVRAQLGGYHTSYGEAKNYSTRDSRMVTHCSTNQAITCLNMAERTGSLVFTFL
jgi:hypothetical protein